MKSIKYIFLIIAVLFVSAIYSQTHPDGHDSDIVNTAVTGAIKVTEVITGHSPLIPFLPDHITGGALASIVFFFIRLFEKRKLRKKGLLTDQVKSEN